MESVRGQMDVQDGQGLAAGPRAALVFLPREKHSAFVCGRPRCCRVGTPGDAGHRGLVLQTRGSETQGAQRAHSLQQKRNFRPKP